MSLTLLFTSSQRTFVFILYYKIIKNDKKRTVMTEYHSKNRHKYLLQAHVVFVCKYRKSVLTEEISNEIKRLSIEICKKHDVVIRYMETDKNHIHYCLDYPPTLAISNLVRTLKSYTAYHIWQKYPNELFKIYWGRKKFWSSGYFVCSIGNVSEKILGEYIKNQGG